MTTLTGCIHNLDRIIHHEPSQIERGESAVELSHSPGDRIVLVCPHGCEDIIVDVVPNPPDGLYDDE